MSVSKNWNVYANEKNNIRKSKSSSFKAIPVLSLFAAFMVVYFTLVNYYFQYS